jgi:hypothetical protein
MIEWFWYLFALPDHLSDSEADANLGMLTKMNQKAYHQHHFL